jgi:hypothetical protein
LPQVVLFLVQQGDVGLVDFLDDVVQTIGCGQRNRVRFAEVCRLDLELHFQKNHHQQVWVEGKVFVWKYGFEFFVIKDLLLPGL